MVMLNAINITSIESMEACIDNLLQGIYTSSVYLPRQLVPLYITVRIAISHCLEIRPIDQVPIQ